jgi:RimJ/RimL family protein N-acetyltransferase
MEPVPDASAMRLLLQHWIAEESQLIPPSGRWAIELREEGTVVGGAVILPLPPRGEDLEMGWQLRPASWGHGYATEAGHALASWAFRQGSDELLAVVRPANRRGEATVRRLGMEWVGETDKYYGLRLQVFRLRPADLLPDSAW